MIGAPLCFYRKQKGSSGSQQPRWVGREAERRSKSGEEERRGDKSEKTLIGAYPRLTIYRLKDNSIGQVTFATHLPFPHSACLHLPKSMCFLCWTQPFSFLQGTVCMHVSDLPVYVRVTSKSSFSLPFSRMALSSFASLRNLKEGGGKKTYELNI